MDAGFTGITDARFYINDAAIPTVIFGPGSLSVAHTADESVAVDDLVQAARIYARLFVGMLRAAEVRGADPSYPGAMSTATAPITVTDAAARKIAQLAARGGPRRADPAPARGRRRLLRLLLRARLRRGRRRRTTT